MYRKFHYLTSKQMKRSTIKIKFFPIVTQVSQTGSHTKLTKQPVSGTSRIFKKRFITEECAKEVHSDRVREFSQASQYKQFKVTSCLTD